MTEPTDKKHLWKPGQSGNPSGRPKGSRQKLQTDFLKVLADDFSEHGKEAVVRMREERPHEYVKAVASLMPRQLEIERPLQDLTDDDLIAAVAALQSFLTPKGVGEGVADKASGEPATDLQSLH